MNYNKLRAVVRDMRSNGILVNGLIFSCTLYLASVLLSHKYDWDIDQFMYFGSRLANGELAFVREYDDKSIAVHALFIIPAWLKSIRVWYIISTAALLVAAYSLYTTLKKYKRLGKSQAIVSTMYFAFLTTSTQGGISHINGMAACMMLIYINGIALSAANSPPLANTNKTPIYILLAAWSVSIRPYYILTILAVITWPVTKTILARGKQRNRPSNERMRDINIVISSLKKVTLLAAFIIAINIAPYILTGEGKALADAFTINKISITPSLQEGIISIFVIAIQKAPLIIAPSIASNIYVTLLIIERVKNRKFNIQSFLKINLDLIYAGLLMPILLATMMSTRHFHNHYLVLFAPFSALTLYLLMAKVAGQKAKESIYRKYSLLEKWSKASRIMIGLGMTYHCIYPMVKINDQFTSSSKVRTQRREYILKELEALTRENGSNKSFVVTRDNHFHWRLNQSRMGIPHASLVSKIATNHENISQATSKASQIKTKFKYPNTSQLCEIMLDAKPHIYLVPKNTAEDACLSTKNSNYTYYKEVERGHTWNLTLTKTGIIYIIDGEIQK